MSHSHVAIFFKAGSVSNLLQSTWTWKKLQLEKACIVGKNCLQRPIQAGLSCIRENGICEIFTCQVTCSQILLTFFFLSWLVVGTPYLPRHYIVSVDWMPIATYGMAPLIRLSKSYWLCGIRKAQNVSITFQVDAKLLTLTTCNERDMCCISLEEHHKCHLYIPTNYFVHDNVLVIVKGKVHMLSFK